MPSREILCEDCASQSAVLKTAGATNISCNPIAGQNGRCELRWDLPRGAGAASGTRKKTPAKPAAKSRSAAAPKAKRKRKPRG